MKRVGTNDTLADAPLPKAKKVKRMTTAGVDEFAQYPAWDEVLPPEKVAVVEKKLNPDPNPNEIALATVAPCPDCEMMTPQRYLVIKGAWELEYYPSDYPDGPPMRTPRSLECVVCGAVWNHSVNMGCAPTKLRELLRLIPPEKAETAEIKENTA